MKAARIHEYGKALVLEDVPVPDIEPDEILVQVKAMRHVPLGRAAHRRLLPSVRRHPDADHDGSRNLRRRVQDRRESFRRWRASQEGDHVGVAPGWGDGVCRHCLVGNTHICPNVRWPGFGPYGGFAEFLPVPARYLVKADRRLKFEEIAPLTDAGLTPYRGIKKLRDAGALGPAGCSAFSASAGSACTRFSTRSCSAAAPRSSRSHATRTSSPSRRRTASTTSSPSRARPPTDDRAGTREGRRARRNWTPSSTAPVRRR